MSIVNGRFIGSGLSALFLAGLAACSDTRHPLDQLLSQIKPVAVVPLRAPEWSRGTLLCPLTPYQSALSGNSSTAQQVNAFLKKKNFQGDEGHWSLVVIAPAPATAPRIEHLIFARGKYDVVTSLRRPDAAAQLALSKFEPKECVEIQEALILATHGGASNRAQLSFGTAK